MQGFPCHLEVVLGVDWLLLRWHLGFPGLRLSSSYGLDVKQLPEAKASWKALCSPHLLNCALLMSQVCLSSQTFIVWAPV